MTIKAKDIYVVCCEGETEINLFGFLTKFNFKNKKFKVKDMEGFSSLPLFKRKYNQILKEWSIKPKKDTLNKKIHFLFFIDKDLEESKKIETFIKSNGHTVQFCDKNTESVLLRIVGVNVEEDTNLKDFRAKCKERFKIKFGQEAHKMKGEDLIKIIQDVQTFKDNFLELYTIFDR